MRLLMGLALLSAAVSVRAEEPKMQRLTSLVGGLGNEAIAQAHQCNFSYGCYWDVLEIAPTENPDDAALVCRSNRACGARASQTVAIATISGSDLKRRGFKLIRLADKSWALADADKAAVGAAQEDARNGFPEKALALLSVTKDDWDKASANAFLPIAKESQSKEARKKNAAAEAAAWVSKAKAEAEYKAIAEQLNPK